MTAVSAMSWRQAIVLAVVQGLADYVPVIGIAKKLVLILVVTAMVAAI